MQSPQSVSVIVAAYNEEAVLADNISRIVAELGRRPAMKWELILVDDGSNDRTGAIIDAAASGDPRIKASHNWRNFGQGRALRNGIRASVYEVLVTLDADLSYGPEYIWRLFDALVEKNVEIALASPYAKGGGVKNVPFHRHVLSRMANYYLARMSNFDISTSTCVVRAYRREVLDSIVLTSDGMELQLEVLMKASMMGCHVYEVPASLEWSNAKTAGNSPRRRSKMRFSDTIRMYLFMGWLQRPAAALIIVSWLLIIPGAYMAATIAFVACRLLGQNLAGGIGSGLHDTLKQLVTNYSQNIVFSGIFLLFGIQLLAFSLILLQNKFYFEELFRLGHRDLIRHDYSHTSTPAPSTRAVQNDPG